MENLYAHVYDDEDDGYDNMDYYDDLKYEYESKYLTAHKESIIELYTNCLRPSIFDTLWYLLPLLVASVLFRLIAHIRIRGEPTCKLFHGSSVLIGLIMLRLYAGDFVHFFILFTAFSYMVLHIPRKFRKGWIVFIPSIIALIYGELSMEPIEWHKVRGIAMVAAMKAISISAVTDKSEDIPSLYVYFGYMYCVVTSVLGPWISIEDYKSLYTQRQPVYEWLVMLITRSFFSIFCLSISNCWSSWIITDNNWKWLIAYRDALAYRTSHYFISYTGTTILLIGGYKLSHADIVKPWKMELPRSLVQVVIYWNMPMHSWLKRYVFRPSLNGCGRFAAVTLTFLVSAMLHGLNFQLAAVLLSLGFYTYAEYQVRKILASTFNACIGAKPCVPYKCKHKNRDDNTIWIKFVNLFFSILCFFNLAYLGLMFDVSELQETGFTYHHTMRKWSELGFFTHWLSLAFYCIYFLIV